MSVVGRIARILISTGSLRLGDFKLSSGGRSSIYIDLRTLPFNPIEFKEALEIASDKAREIIRERSIDAILGVAMGGVPWAIGLGLMLNMPTTYIRLDRKGHGTGRLIEADVRGLRLLVIDDVATTGGSLARAIDVARSMGALVDSSLVIVDRGQGAFERLSGMGVTLYSLAKLKDLLLELASMGFIDEYTLSRVLVELGG